jgi:hypothetical protein
MQMFAGLDASAALTDQIVVSLTHRLGLVSGTASIENDGPQGAITKWGPANAATHEGFRHWILA